jgi:hypothetical protein
VWKLQSYDLLFFFDFISNYQLYNLIYNKLFLHFEGEEKINFFPFLPNFLILGAQLLGASGKIAAFPSSLLRGECLDDEAQKKVAAFAQGEGGT